MSATAPPKTATLGGGGNGSRHRSPENADAGPPVREPGEAGVLDGGRAVIAASCTAISAPTFALCRTLCNGFARRRKQTAGW